MKENQPQFLEIYKLLRKTLGSGIKCLHEPLFFKSEIQNLKKCIDHYSHVHSIDRIEFSFLILEHRH